MASLLLTLVAAASHRTAMAQSSPVNRKYVQALQQIESQWNKEYEAKDLDRIVAHYTDDAVVMAPGEPAASGKSAIRSSLQQMIGDPAFSLKFTPEQVDVAKSGDMAYTRGRYTMHMKDPSTQKSVDDTGSYVTVYRKQSDGAWKAVADIASSQGPSSGK